MTPKYPMILFIIAIVVAISLKRVDGGCFDCFGGSLSGYDKLEQMAIRREDCPEACRGLLTERDCEDRSSEYTTSSKCDCYVSRDRGTWRCLSHYA